MSASDNQLKNFKEQQKVFIIDIKKLSAPLNVNLWLFNSWTLSENSQHRLYKNFKNRDKKIVEI